MSSTTRYIVEYFKGEKQESFIFIAAGLVAMALAYYGFMIADDTLYFGAAVPLAGIGLIELIVGGSIATKTNEQIKALLETRESSPSTFKSYELSRMEDVMKNFRIYRTIEQVFFIVGLLFMVLGLTDRISRYMAGVGIGLMLQSSVMLFLDLFAELRGKEYIRRLSKEHFGSTQ